VQIPEQGLWRAGFSLKLAGFRMPPSEKNLPFRFKALRVESLATSMSPGQYLELRYTIGKNSLGRSVFACEICGIVEGAERSETLHSAEEFREQIGTLKAALLPGLVFVSRRPVPGTHAQRPPRGWGARIEPLGVSIDAGVPISPDDLNPGVLRAEVRERPAGVIFPAGRGEPAISLDSLILGSRSLNRPVRLIIRFCMVFLGPAEQKRLSDIIGGLASGKNGAVPAGMPFRTESSDSDTDVHAQDIVEQARLWLRRPVGCRIRVLAFSPAPIPAAFLKLVGEEIFQGSPVDIVDIPDFPPDGTRPGEDRAKKEGTTTLDLNLHDCVNALSALPPLMPSPSQLKELGVERMHPAPPNLPKEGILIGRAGLGTDRRSVRFATKDRMRHCYILGATGVGKSTLLRNLVIQDMRAGEGLALIDPHGDLYDEILENIPKRREKDVVLIDPGDFERAVGINLLDCRGPWRAVQVNYVVNELICIFDRLYDLRTTGGPIFEMYMRNALLLSLNSGQPNPTLLDVPRIFQDKDFRRFLVKRCKDPLVRDFWRKEAEQVTGEVSLQNLTPYVTSKLNQFVSNAILRPMIGQKSKMDFRRMMDEGKIVLVKLSKGLLGELDTKLLGMLLIGRIFQSAMERLDRKPAERRGMFLYVDEFQNFVTDSVAFLLSEARKFGLGMTLANQTLSQLRANPGKQDLLETVLGNAGSLLIFRCGPRDAKILEPYVAPAMDAQDLQELPDFHAAGRILAANMPVAGVRIKTLPAFRLPREKAADPKILRRRNHRYSMPVEMVEKSIAEHRAMYP